MQLWKAGLLILFSSGLMAQGKMVLTLEEAIPIALENNPEIKIAEKELTKAQAAVWEAYSTVMPSLNGSVSFQHAWSIQETTIPNFIKFMLGPMAQMIPELADMPDYVKLSFGLENTFVYGVNLTQPLYLGGAGVAGIRMSMAGKKAALYNLEMSRQNLIHQTSQAFFSCILAQELVRVQEQAMEQAQANLDIVEKKYNAGSASGFDRMRAQVEVANLKPEVINANNNLKMALTLLKNVLGMEVNTAIDVKGSLNYQKDEFGRTELAELQKIARINRPEVLALGEHKYITSKNINIARSQFLPKLFFSTDYSKMAMRNDYKFAERDFSEGFTSAFALQIPLFSGFRNAKGYQKAKLDYRIMVDSEKQLNDGIDAQVEVAYNVFQEADQKYKSAVESVDLAEEALRLATLMYEEGASTQLDVLNSQLALTRARLNYINTVFQYQMARYELRKSTGTLEGIL
ncbi:TolC family protein [candidate division KSB1 bacterium]|nr:TolC family protein [candidate division KSB1 bacterium]